MSLHGTILGAIRELHRYPVKSMAGERLDRLALDRRGVVGDRRWAVYDPDGKIGSGKSTRRFRRMPGLLELRAAYGGEAVAMLSFPDGRSFRAGDADVHAALSAHVGRPVHLAAEDQVSHFDEGPVHLVTTASLDTASARHGGAVDPRRLRANLVVDTGAATGLPENAWAGHRIALGDEVVIEVLYPMPRCVMLDLPSVGVPARKGLLQAVTGLSGGDAGVVADVVTPGTVAVGDVVRRLRSSG